MLLNVDFMNATIMKCESGVILQIIAKDHFMVTAGGDKLVIWNFASNAVSWMESKTKHAAQVNINHDEAITCMSLSRDGTLTATGNNSSNITSGSPD